MHRVPRSGPFRLLRYFSLASLLLIAVAIAVLSHVYRQLVMAELMDSGESHNAETAVILANATWPEFGPFLRSASGLGGDALRAHPEIKRLDGALRRQVQGTSVIKIKIYAMNGRTLYSSEAKQIGEDKSGNAGFLAARAGGRASEITHRNQFSAFDQVIEDRGVLSSYFPLRNAAGHVEGVFELYDDITPLVEQIDRSQIQATLGAAAVLLALYGALLLIVMRADRILREQHAAQQNHEAGLESRIAERTVELVQALDTSARREEQVREGAKQLQCRYAISSLVAGTDKSAEEILATAVRLVAAGWNYPEIACARIIFNDREFTTDNFRETPWKLSANIVIDKKTSGRLEVVYLEERPARHEGPFLREERSLIDNLAKILSAGIWRRYTAETLSQQSVELTRSRDAAEAASRAKSAFLANMSHELRTPLNAILGLGHLVGARLVEPALRAQVETITRSGQHLLEMVNQVLEMSALEADEFQLEATDFALPALLEEALGALRGRADSKGLVLAHEIDPALPRWLRGDAPRLGRILATFTGNAVKFSEHGRVKLRARLVESAGDDLRVRFEVEDQGIGLGAEKQAALFSTFEQADNSTTRRHGGLGLALALCKRLAQRMGGEIGVNSTPGQGSTFWIEIPLKPALDRGQAETRPPTEPAQETPAAARTQPPDPAAVSALLEQLDALLAQSDTAAMALFDKHAAALRAALGAQGEQLGREIGRFEFAAARERLRALQKECLQP